jgi:hypothetical protein
VGALQTARAGRSARADAPARTGAAARRHEHARRRSRTTATADPTQQTASFQIKTPDQPLPCPPAVLRDVNLTLQRSTVTALVGRSGAGKSTVAALLSRFYMPQQGSILLNGVDAGSFTRGEWARAIAMVSQVRRGLLGSLAQRAAGGSARPARRGPRPAPAERRTAAAAAPAVTAVEAEAQRARARGASPAPAPPSLRACRLLHPTPPHPPNPVRPAPRSPSCSPAPSPTTSPTAALASAAPRRFAPPRRPPTRTSSSRGCQTGTKRSWGSGARCCRVGGLWGVWGRGASEGGGPRGPPPAPLAGAQHGGRAGRERISICVLAREKRVRARVRRAHACCALRPSRLPRAPTLIAHPAPTRAPPRPAPQAGSASASPSRGRCSRTPP